jgi:tripartite-type tricarboxylate transporter receptor subunit TctC
MPYEHHRPLSRSAAVRHVASGVLALCMAGATSASLAQASDAAGYPRKPIRLIVPFTVGGSTDILARAIGQQLTQAWGQAVVVDNVPGAGGSIGADKVAKSSADGYTLLMGHIGSLAVTPSLYPRLPYDPVKAFAAVAWIARVPNVLVVHPSVPAKTVDELVAYAKANPGKLNYGSGGNGSAAHIATEYLKVKTGAPISHVPYRGTSPSVNDLLAGQSRATSGHRSVISGPGLRPARGADGGRSRTARVRGRSVVWHRRAVRHTHGRHRSAEPADQRIAERARSR